MKMIFALVLVLGFSCFSFAEQEMAKAPCKADMEKLCVGIEPGDGRMMKCLHDNESKLSSECQAKRSEMKEKMKGAHESCREDVEKFCGDVKHGHGAVMKCLKAHDAEVSQACKDAAPHRRHKK